MGGRSDGRSRSWFLVRPRRVSHTVFVPGDTWRVLMVAGSTLVAGCVRPGPGIGGAETASTETGSATDGGTESGGVDVCPDGTLQLSALNTQTAVDAAEGCTRTLSHLQIGTCFPAGGCGDLEPPVASVAPLYALEEVGGDLELLSTDEWTSLEGLEGLRTVGGGLRVGSGATHLAEFSGLEPLASLEHVREVEIYFAYQLTSLDGLEGIEKDALEAVTIDHAPSIQNIEALAGIRNVGLKLIGLDALESLAGLEMLEGPSFLVEGAGITDASAIGGLKGELLAYGVYDCPELTALSVSNQITAAEYVELGRMPKLQAVEGMAGLKHVDFVDLSELPALSQPLEFPALESVGLARLWDGGVSEVRFPSLTIAENLDFDGPGITTLGFPVLAETTESIRLAPADLSTLDLGALVHVGQDLVISGTSLTNLEGLAALETVGGNLEITGNSELPTALAESFAAGIEVGGDVDVSGNAP